MEKMKPTGFVSLLVFVFLSSYFHCIQNWFLIFFTKVTTLLGRPKKKGQGTRYSQNSLTHPKSEPDFSELEREEEIRVKQMTDDEVNEKFEHMLVSEVWSSSYQLRYYVVNYKDTTF